MTWFLRVLCFPVAVILLMGFSGCCCTCSSDGDFTLPSNFSSQGGGEPDKAFDTSGLSDAEIKELETAQDWANKALSKVDKDYGKVKSVELSKDGLNWYVSGKMNDLDGEEVDYQVWFEVKRSGDRQTWAVRSVKVNDEVVF